MKRTFIYCYIVTFLMLMSVNTSSAYNLEKYKDWMELDSDELMKRGQECENRESMDSALIYYSIVSNRAYGTSDKDVIKKSCEAYINRSMIYFSYFYDYSKAYENILAAMELKNKNDVEISLVENTASIFYHVIAVTCRDWNIEKLAVEHSVMAYEGIRDNKDDKLIDEIVCNLMIMTCNLDDYKELAKVWESYKNYNNNTFSYSFNNKFYDYINYCKAKNYDKALDVSENMLNLSLEKQDKRRTILSYSLIIEAINLKGDYKMALDYLGRQEQLVQKWKIRESIIEILDKKEKLYRKIGETALADECSRMYYSKKDSLLNLKQMNNILRTQFNGESRKMEKEIQQITIQNNIYNKVFIIIMIFVIILLIMVIMLRIKIKQLKKCNITIYENNEENIKHEDKERQKLKDEVLKLENVSTGISSVPDFTVEKTEIIEDDKNNDEEKYKNTSISDDEKKKLLDKILTVMEDVDEICSESFSGARLAELTGYKYNYVSLVINENYGCNFNSLLNKFRIKEACRRLADDEHYGKYTIDSISNSLGFKSRTTLVTSFKKIVGLTPSQYRAIAKEKGNN